MYVCIHILYICIIRTNITGREVVLSKNSSILEIYQFLFGVSDCCYGYCDQFCDWQLQLSDYRCPITVNCPITLCDFNCTEWLGKSKVANAPITFEEMQRL